MNVALSRTQYKLVLIGDRSTFTARAFGASPEEQEARGYYRRLFDVLDTLVAERSAKIMRTNNL